ncbi:unnamed protein product [Porites evermanni]|uniref:Uncharacterized protein n=1 Tax=Porites evermanni TaxID=104178 RepID=A0ABN8S943_9CNID|nr:unnamed protein product [Porites evermanni]
MPRDHQRHNLKDLTNKEQERDMPRDHQRHNLKDLTNEEQER